MPWNNKKSITKNIWYYKIIFSLTTPTLSRKLFFMRAEDCVNLIILTVALFMVSQTMQCIALTVQCFYLRGNKDIYDVWKHNLCILSCWGEYFTLVPLSPFIRYPLSKFALRPWNGCFFDFFYVFSSIVSKMLFQTDFNFSISKTPTMNLGKMLKIIYQKRSYFNSFCSVS